MALPSPLIIDLAKAYAYRLERGYTAVEARTYLLGFAATRGQIDRAIYQAQRAIAVGQTIEQMGLDVHLSEALEGQRRPAGTVGVRVQLTRFDVDRPGVQTRDERHDLYIEVPWDATKRDVIQRARTWFENSLRGSGPARAWELHFVGPTLWPGASPGLSLEG